jgi:Ca2+-binding EF-hand superfamily protein
MLFKDSVLLDRLFRVFDKNDDDAISFSEFIACVTKLSTKASEQDKLRCEYTTQTADHVELFRNSVVFTVSFDIYDFDGDDFIGTSDLTSLLAAGLREHGVVINRTALDEVVNRTMEQAKPATAGFITFDEYVAVVSTHPQIIAHMTLNVSG